MTPRKKNEELGRMEASKCPKCGEEPSFVEHMEKWYCYECNTYVHDTGEIEFEPAEAELQTEEQVQVEEEPVPSEAPVAEPEGDFKDYSDAYEEEIALPEEPEAKPEPAVVEAEEVPETPPAKPKEEPAIRMCPNCGQPLKWIDKYQRHYCYSCKKYAPKEEPKAAPKPEPKPEPKAVPAAVPAAPSKPAPEKKSCPDCGKELRFIEKYNEYYCYGCKKYPLRRRKGHARKAEEKPAKAPSKPTGKVCPKCNGPVKWIEKYNRHYCYECKAYMPKETKKCPACGEEMKFIAQYNEWYCYKCRKYSLRPSKPVLLL